MSRRTRYCMHFKKGDCALHSSVLPNAGASAYVNRWPNGALIRADRESGQSIAPM
jgi:hypothetical protein